MHYLGILIRFSLSSTMLTCLFLVSLSLCTNTNEVHEEHCHAAVLQEASLAYFVSARHQTGPSHAAVQDGTCSTFPARLQVCSFISKMAESMDC